MSKFEHQPSDNLKFGKYWEFKITMNFKIKNNENHHEQMDNLHKQLKITLQEIFKQYLTDYQMSLDEAKLIE